MTENTKELHLEAIDILREAEAQIETILEHADIKAAITVANGDDVNGAKDSALNTLADAQQRAESIAQNAIERINSLMVEAGDPAEAERLTAVLQSAIDNPRPGIRFSEHLERVSDEEVTGIEVAALKAEGALSAVMNPFLSDFEDALANLSKPVSTPHAHADHALHSDTVDLFGNEVTVPGGLYTVVFVVLAVVTIVEVLIAESGMPNVIGFPLLSALSIGKAVLVVMYYMHLREDSRIFIWSFGVPLAMAALIIIFLLIMNPVTY